ncbi:MAG: hypothetical protein MZV64_08865 [Ignavibacteriales bacterium]|nr:hypothetical protein [Ignavibacteriales bacterium]
MLMNHWQFPAILESQKLLTNTMKAFKTRCVDGITANEDVMTKYINQSVGIVTALNPALAMRKQRSLQRKLLKQAKEFLNSFVSKNY